MPTQVNSNYSANFQKFVDFASKAYATKGENTVARFKGMPKGDYNGTFASFFRSSNMKTANNQVRDLFRKAVADMFGGEKFIPDLVRDNMKLEDFDKGKPLTARRIHLVQTAIDLLGGGKFISGASVEKAHSMGYMSSEMPKLARVANIYQQATGCTDAEAETAALDPGSNARRLFDYGGRFTLNAENFKKGLALMDKFDGWYGNLMDDCAAKKQDTPTKLNLNASVCTRDAAKAVQKFVFEEIAVNGKLSLDAANPEDMFGMAKNAAMRFVGRGYTTSFANSLAQIPPEKRSVLYAVFDALDKLPASAGELAKRERVDYAMLVAARVMKNIDAVTSLQKSGKLDRAHLVPLLYPDLGVSSGDSNKQIKNAYESKVSEDPANMASLHMLAENSGATLEEVAAAINSGTRLENAPGISSFTGKLEELDGTALGGRKTMIYDLVRPTTPNMTDSGEYALEDENVKFVFNFPDGEQLNTITGSLDEQNVRSRCDAIADKIADLCGNVHPKQLSSVYFALSQSAIGVNVNGGFQSAGVASDEHMPVTFTLSRNAETGAVTIKYSEPKGFPVKFNWTMTIDVDGKSTTTPMRIDQGQYEAKAMSFVDEIADKIPGKDRTAAETLIKETLAHCGDDFELKDIVSKSIRGICITAASKLRSADQIKARIDAVRANLEEIRKEAAGDQAVEKAGKYFLEGLNGKSVPPALIGKIVKAANAQSAGDIAKLSATSTPQQILKAITDLRTGVETVMFNAKVKDYLEGGDEMVSVRDFATMLLLAKLPDAQLQGASAAFSSETASKLISVLDDFAVDKFPAGASVPSGMAGWISSQSMSLSSLVKQYNLGVEAILGKNAAAIKAFDGPFDEKAFGTKDILKTVSALAELDAKAYDAKQLRDENVRTGFKTAKTKAGNAYSKAGEGNAATVDKLIYAALTRCADNEDAVKVVADNIDNILVSSTAKLRSIETVRDRAEAVAANFEELKELSKDNPAIYEVGKRMMAAMGGKALPSGTIGRLVSEAMNVKIDAIRKLSPRSSAMDIHSAVTQLRDNLVQVMNASGAETAAIGPDEKQACRNFIAGVIMNRCGANALHAMKDAFAGETPVKLLAFYTAIEKGYFKENLDHEALMRLEDRADSHRMYLISLKGAIDLAVDGRLGVDIAQFSGELDPDEINGGDIFDDLLNASN